MIGTPIGNLEDLSPRAVRVMNEVGLILAEDTRVTRTLTARFGIPTPMASYHAHTAPARRLRLLDRLDAEDLALVSDAGTPGVSDPGAELVATAAARGHTVVAIAGPSAVAAALSVSGLSGAPYAFLGFLPRKAKERRASLRAASALPMTLVAFETPHRLRAALDDLHAELGDRPIAVARELTKRYESVWRGSLSEACEHWREEAPRGEFTLVIGALEPAEREPWSRDAVRAALDDLRAAGVGAREASRSLADESGWPARDLYRAWHEQPPADTNRDDIYSGPAAAVDDVHREPSLDAGSTAETAIDDDRATKAPTEDPT